MKRGMQVGKEGMHTDMYMLYVQFMYSMYRRFKTHFFMGSVSLTQPPESRIFCC